MNDQKFGRVEGVPEDEPCFVLRAKDDAAIHTLRAYQRECRTLGSPDEHVAAINVIVERFDAWRDANPLRTKVPD